MIRLTDEFIFGDSPDPSPEAIARLARLLEFGRPIEKQRACRKLAAVGAEKALTTCLGSADPATAELALAGLQECWRNEKGPEARRLIETGITLMQKGNFSGAEDIFRLLEDEFPDWAEALHQQASLLYLQGFLDDSCELCELVVGMKPNHFSAWSSMARCAVEMEDWGTALEAARRAVKLQPTDTATRRILKLAKAKLEFT